MAGQRISKLDILEKIVRVNIYLDEPIAVESYNPQGILKYWDLTIMGKDYIKLTTHEAAYMLDGLLLGLEKYADPINAPPQEKAEDPAEATA
jgi:hypothetical protein